MIKFFRHIRQKLLSENKFSNYLLYAIGEIILVVIGILIALQVNNWNNHRNERAAEKTYLEALKTEFRTNLSTLDEAIGSNEKLALQLGEILTFFNPKKLDTLSSEKIGQAIGEALRYGVVFNPTTAVQKDIVSSGNLRLISNPDLRQKIASFETVLETIRSQETGASEARNDVGNNITEKISFRAIFESVGFKVSGSSELEYADIKQLFSSIEFENKLILYQGITETTKNAYYLPLKNEINTVLEIIDKELKP